MKFLGTEYSVNTVDKAAIIILPIPYEFSTSYGKGTKNGPRAIIKASPYLEFYDEQYRIEPWREGIFTAESITPDKTPQSTMQSITRIVSSLIDRNKFIISLGGEHSISYGIYRAYHGRFKDLSVLQMDAHSDIRDQYEGTKFSHACVMRRIWEMNSQIVQVGIRSQSIEESNFISKNHIKIMYAHQLYQYGFNERILEALGENVYITLDVDFFDPSLMPSTGTPEPGGFQWYESMVFLERVFTQKNVVGMDIVEYSPIKNLIAPDFMMAKLIYKLIACYLIGR